MKSTWNFLGPLAHNGQVKRAQQPVLTIVQVREQFDSYAEKYPQ